jgi:hypothetical protein
MKIKSMKIKKIKPRRSVLQQDSSIGTPIPPSLHPHGHTDSTVYFPL